MCSSFLVVLFFFHRRLVYNVDARHRDSLCHKEATKVYGRSAAEAGVRLLRFATQRTHSLMSERAFDQYLSVCVYVCMCVQAMHNIIRCVARS